MNDMHEMTSAIAETLALCEAMGLAGQRVRIDNPDVLRMFAVILDRAAIGPDALRASMPIFFAAEEFFPSPAKLVLHARPVQDEMDRASRAALLARFVPCVDDGGWDMLAPPERVRDGRLLAVGDDSGDGSQAPRLTRPGGLP